MATRSNPRWYTRRVREPGPDIDPSTFQRLEGAEQQLGRPMSDDEKRQWLESQLALDPGFVEWHGAPPEEVGNLLPGERVHTADGWWFRSGEGSEAGKYFFKNEAPSAPGGYMRAAENPRSRHAPREHIEPGVKTIFVFREQEPYSASGFAYRAYRADKTPLYIGAESMRELEGKLKDHLLGRDPDFMPSYRVVKMPADFE